MDGMDGIGSQSHLFIYFLAYDRAGMGLGWASVSSHPQLSAPLISFFFVSFFLLISTLFKVREPKTTKRYSHIILHAKKRHQ
jgi:hypothetical protein